MDRNEKSHDQVSLTATSGAEEDPAGDSKLAQSIWGRYGHSPGVIPMAGMLGLARRTRLSTDRLPLLVDIQRRWGGTEASFSHGWFALPYAWPIGLAGTLFPSTNVVQSAPERAPRNFGRANPIPPSGDLAGSQRVVSALPARGRDSPDRSAVEKVQRGGVGSSISPAEEPPILQPAAGVTQHASEARDEASVATSVGDLGAGILRRHLSGPVARAMQQRPGMPQAGGRMHPTGGTVKIKGNTSESPFLKGGFRGISENGIQANGHHPSAGYAPGGPEGGGIFDVLPRAEGPVALSKAVSRTDPMAGVEYPPAGTQDSMPTVAGRKISPSSSSGKEAPMRHPASEAQAADNAASKSSNLEAIIRQKQEPGESVVAEISTKASGAVNSSQSVILGKIIGKRIRDGTNPETSEKLGRMDGGFPPDTMVRVQGRQSASATGFARRSELNQPLVSLVNAHMILRKSSTRQSYEPQGKPMVSPTGLVTAQPAALVVQPQQEGVETKNWQSTGKATGAADRGRASVRVQIPSYLSPMPKPDMVWRKSTIESSASNLFSAGTSVGAKTSLPLTINSAGGSVLSMARQTTTAASPAVEPGTPEGSESPIPIGEKGPEHSNEMDLQQLAEQVSRLIFRKLVVERERRGIGRWH